MFLPRLLLLRVAQPRPLTRGLTSVSVSKDGSVHHVTMDSPKTRNALSLDMMSALRTALKEANNSSSTRVVVLRGVGPAFSSGHNLKELTAEHGREHQEAVFTECARLMTDVLRMRAPVIAAVDGIAAAAGCQLAATCDIVLATEKSMFSTPGAAFGVFCSTPGIPLARNVPRKVSSYMLLTGKPISASEALRAGLVSRLASDSDALDLEVDEAVNAIVAKPRVVIEMGKKFYYRQLELGITQAQEEGGRVMVENLQLLDSQEGLKAFKEKRKPKWTHSDDTV